MELRNAFLCEDHGAVVTSEAENDQDLRVLEVLKTQGSHNDR